jgi:hypothetical protein
VADISDHPDLQYSTDPPLFSHLFLSIFVKNSLVSVNRTCSLIKDLQIYYRVLRLKLHKPKLMVPKNPLYYTGGFLLV